MVQPLPFPVIEVVIVNYAVALCASEAIWQLTACVEPLYVQPGPGRTTRGRAAWHDNVLSGVGTEVVNAKSPDCV